MILQALREYYERKASDSESGIAPLGWEWKALPFLIVIRADGSFDHVEDTQDVVGKKKQAKLFLVPQAVKRSSGIAANLLWDNVEYVTGIPCKGKPERVNEQHKAFIKRLEMIAQCPTAAKVLTFLKSQDLKELLTQDSTVKEALETNAFLSFKIFGHDKPVFREADIVEALSSSESSSGDLGICLVSGRHESIAGLHPAIKGVQDTNTTGGNIVSFNFDAACSFGKKQGFNAPVGQTSAFEYTTALNSLLSKESRQRMLVGDATTVFWSERQSTLEDEFASLFAEPEKDNPDKGVDAVERLLSSVHDGVFSTDKENNRFYVLGLSPNSARISVRFWHEGTVAEMEGRFADWFENLRIVHGPNEREHLSLWRLLLSLSVQSKSENIPPNLAGAVMRSILDGTPYPMTLLSSAILRNKAEQNVTYPRAKIIKAFLIHNLKRSITVSLDKENINIGYRLGRLFAVLERIQYAANPGINATIRGRFYSAASSTPLTVFANLMRLKNYHLNKLDSSKFFDELLDEILDGVSASALPVHLSLEEQAQFALGYHQQRHDLFAKKESKESSNEQNT